MAQALMKTLGVILARGGSQGLTGKHLRPLLGRRVITYTFDEVRASRLLDRVIVSSDCPHILSLARSMNFETVERPAHLATADASVQDVMLHALKHAEITGEFHADALAVLYGNIPVRELGVIDRAIEHLQNSGCDSVRSFCPVGKWHPAWMSTLEDDRVVPLRAGSVHRRQDLEPVYLHDGAVVAVSRASMLRGEQFSNDPHAFFGIDRRGIQTEMGATIEIDHLRDLYWAEAVLRDRHEPARKAAS